jgi:hypothetical protein
MGVADKFSAIPTRQGKKNQYFINIIDDTALSLRKSMLRFVLNRWITTAAETADAVVLLIP